MLTLIGDQLVNGVFVGVGYALAAVGLTLIFGVLRAINFAHGDFYMLGAFAAWASMTYLGLPYGVSIVAALAAGVAIALVTSRFVAEPLAEAPFQNAVLATLGVSLTLQAAVTLLAGGTFKEVTGGWMDVIDIWGIRAVEQRWLLIGVTVAVFVSLELLVRYSRAGKAMRAVAQNREACRVVGIDIQRVTRNAFVLGISLAVISGALLGPILVSIYPAMGEGITFKAFAITVIAGVGNVWGVLISALFLGIAESLVSGFLGTTFREAVGFVAMIAILMWKPLGLFAARARY